MSTISAINDIEITEQEKKILLMKSKNYQTLVTIVEKSTHKVF